MAMLPKLMSHYPNPCQAGENLGQAGVLLIDSLRLRQMPGLVDTSWHFASECGEFQLTEGGGYSASAGATLIVMLALPHEHILFWEVGFILESLDECIKHVLR